MAAGCWKAQWICFLAMVFARSTRALVLQHNASKMSMHSSSWSASMSSGTISTSSSQCTTYNAFRQSLTGSYLSATAGGVTHTCSSATAIVAAFSSGSSGSWDCDGHTWRVGNCAVSGTESEICVDCASICNCNSGLSIRPCIGNTNWGGYSTTCGAGATTLSIQLPAANPATVPVQWRSRKEAECRKSATPTSGLNWDGS